MYRIYTPEIELCIMMIVFATLQIDGWALEYAGQFGRRSSHMYEYEAVRGKKNEATKERVQA